MRVSQASGRPLLGVFVRLTLQINGSRYIEGTWSNSLVIIKIPNSIIRATTIADRFWLEK